MEIIEINKNSIYLDISNLKNIFIAKPVKYIFVFPINYDISFGYDYSDLKNINFKIINDINLNKIIYIKNLLFLNSKKIRVNDYFIKICNNYFNKLWNIFIKDINKSLQTLNKILNVNNFSTHFFNNKIKNKFKNKEFQNLKENLLKNIPESNIKSLDFINRNLIKIPRKINIRENNFKNNSEEFDNFKIDIKIMLKYCFYIL